MADSVGTIRAQMVLDVRQALANFTAVRLANLQTVTALRTGGGALVTAGAGMAAVGAGMLAALGLAADAAAEFERQLDFFGAVSNSTATEMEGVRQAALDLGKDTIYSAGQIADSFVELGKAGVEAEDIIGGIGEAVANMGAAADIPLDTAANIILSAVQTFQLSANDAVGVADLLAGAANASIVEVEDLGVSLKYAGGVANSLGVPLEEVVDALGLLGTYGIKGSTAGTSLRQMLVSLGGNSKAAKKELKNLGIITEDGTNLFYDAAGSAKPLSEIFQLLQDKTAGLTDAQKTAAFRTIFQNRALSAALSLTEAGAEGFENMNTAIGKTTAMDVASKRLNNLSGDVEILKGNMETLAIESGSQIQAFLRGLVQNLTKVVQWFGNLSPETQKWIIQLTGIIAVGMIFVGVMGMIAGGLLNLIAAAKQVGPAIGLMSKLIKAATTAQWGLNAAFLANPITWIVIAVIALIAALVWFFTQTEVGKKAWAAFIGWLQTAWENILAFFQGLPAWFSNLWNSITTKVTEIWNNIIEFFKSIPQRILDFFLNWTLPGLLIQHWDTIWATIVSAWDSILLFFQELPGKMADFFKELPGKIGYWIGFMIGTVVRLLIDFGLKAAEIIKTAWDAIVNFFKELPGRLVAIFVTVRDWVIEKWNQLKDWTIESAVNMYESIVDWIKKLPGRLRDLFTNARDWAIAKFNDLKSKAITTAINLYNGIVDWVTKLPGRIRDFFIDAKDWAIEKFNELKTKAIEIATNIYTGIRDEILAIPTKVKEIFTDAIANVTDFVGQAWDAAKDFGSGLWEGFKDGMGINSPSYIEEAMWQMTDVLDDETQHMKKQVRVIQGLGNGITEVGNDLGTGFDDNLSSSLNGMQQQLKAAQAYDRELARIAQTSSEVARGVSIGSTGINDKVIVQGGNTIHMDVEWNAATNDDISTRQQARDMLGRTATILGGDLEDEN